MALTLKDRSKQRVAANAGTGSITLTTCVTGCSTISSVLSNGDTSYFCLESSNGDWEVFAGTYTSSGTTISRDTVLASSNGGSKINLGESITFCYIVAPADKITFKNTAGEIVVPSVGLRFSDASVQTTAPDLSIYLTSATAASTYALLLHTHAASNIISGTIDTARLGSGTANSGTFLRGDSSWAAIDLSTYVVGPASATDNAIVRFDSTTGKLVQNSSATIGDNGFLGIGVAADSTYVGNFQAGSTTHFRVANTTSGATILHVDSSGMTFSFSVDGAGGAMSMQPTNTSAFKPFVLTTAGAITIGGNTTSVVPLTVTSASTQVGLVVKAAVSHSANLTEWQNSSGTVLAAFKSSGRLDLSGTFGGTASTPQLQFASEGGATGFRNYGTGASGYVLFSSQSVDRMLFGNSIFQFASDVNIKWATSSTDPNTTTDTGLKRSSAGLLQITDGSTGFGQLTCSTITLADAANIAVNTTTGTKIGTATSQKLGLWNATPIVQPTTAIAAATLVSNLGTPITSTDTFDGYTLLQITKALRDMGALA